MSRLMLGILAICGPAALAAQSSDEERPAYERLLTGESAANAKNLARRIADAQRADTYDVAIKLADELFALRTKAQGADHWETVEQKWMLEYLRRVAVLSPEDRARWRKSVAGSNEATNLRQAGRFADAIPLCREHLTWCQKVLGKEHPDTASAFNAVARNIESAGRPAEAQPLYEQALAIWKKTLGETHPHTASGYNNLALNLNELGRGREALPLFQAVLKTRQAVLGEDHDDTVIAYNNLALNLQSLGKNADAEPLFRRALETSRRIHEGDHPSQARGCLNLSINLNVQGKTAEALPLARQAVSICRRTLGDDHPHTANCFNNLGNLFRDQGRFAEAEAAHRAALDIRRRVLPDPHPLTASSLNNLAGTLQDQEEYAQAQPLYQEALDIFRKVYGERHRETATAYMNLGGNASKLGRRAESIRLREKAVDIYRETVGEEHPDFAQALHNLSVELAHGGKPDEGERLARAALAIWRRVHGEYHDSTALEYHSLASDVAAQGKYPEARDLAEAGARAYEGARVLLAAQGLERAPFAAGQFPYRLLAAIRAQLGDPAGAWEAAEADLARGLLDEAAARRGGSFTAAEQKQQAALAGRLRELEPRILSIVSQRVPSDAEQTELARLQAERRDFERQLADLAIVASRRELAPLARIQAAIPAGAALVLWIDVSGGQVEEHWGCVVGHATGPHWERLPGSGPNGKWTPGDNDLTSDFTTEIVHGNVAGGGLSALRERLYAQRIAPLLKHLGGVKTLYVVPVNYMSGVPVEALARDFTIGYLPSGTFLARLKERPIPTGRRLLALGDPVFGDSSEGSADLQPLPPGGLLITAVAPDGAAAKARLQAGDVLVRYGEIEVTSGEKLAAEIKAQSAAKEVAITVWRAGVRESFTRAVPPGKLGIVVAIEPARQALAKRRESEAMLLARRGGEWKDLPGTRVELNQLAALFPAETTTLVDSAASEQALEDLRQQGELARFRYLHFATHGESNDKLAFESRLILSQDKLPTNPPPRTGAPFLDGQLSAREVLYYWKLDAELVTLSACETALGRFGGGDGLLGFAQAFLVAGSRAVCLSLWKVDDTATALLMNRFYQNLLGKRPGLDKPLGKAAALAEAKEWLRNLSSEDALKLTASMTKGVVRGTRGKGEDLKLVVPTADPKEPTAKDAKPFAHPRYWSAFVLIGDPN